MADEYDPMPIPRAEGIQPTRPHDEANRQRRRQQQRHEEDEGEGAEPPPPEEAAEHFDQLAAAAEEAHTRLVEEDSPYRFCVYREDGEVYIDIVRLDADGGIADTVRRNITHQEFDRWINAILTGEGLFFEGTA